MNENKESVGLIWHLGQLYAVNDQYHKAIKEMKKCYRDNSTDARKAWNYYVHGTIAFLKNDESELELYIDSLSSHTETMNIEVLIRLKANIDKPYKDAYQQVN